MNKRFWLGLVPTVAGAGVLCWFYDLHPSVPLFVLCILVSMLWGGAMSIVSEWWVK